MKWSRLPDSDAWRIDKTGSFLLHRVAAADGTPIAYAVVELKTLGIFPTVREARALAELAQEVQAMAVEA